MQTEIFIPLKDQDAFDALWAANAEALESEITKDEAHALACNCSWMVGGGAAPLLRVGFVD